jgi:hypothetical protein
MRQSAKKVTDIQDLFNERKRKRITGDSCSEVGVLNSLVLAKRVDNGTCSGHQRDRYQYLYHCMLLKITDGHLLRGTCVVFKCVYMI